ncbi:MAG TPA: hypothetical protein VII52_00590 [Gemmatimonadaceae bacterium]
MDREEEQGVTATATDGLWLATLHSVCGRTAHELKGALNGVAVNLEVVRSRALQVGGPAANVSTFAGAAVDQLSVVISMTEALLSLARPIREPAEPGLLLARLHALLAPAARADGRHLELNGDFGDLGVTSAAGSAVGMSIGGCVLAAVDASSDVQCRPVFDGPVPAICIECGDGAVPSIDSEIVSAAADAGIQIVAESSVIIISFPR